jgi:hypothetical protein
MVREKFFAGSGACDSDRNLTRANPGDIDPQRCLGLGNASDQREKKTKSSRDFHIG